MNHNLISIVDQRELSYDCWRLLSFTANGKLKDFLQWCRAKLYLFVRQDLVQLTPFVRNTSPTCIHLFHKSVLTHVNLLDTYKQNWGEVTGISKSQRLRGTSLSFFCQTIELDFITDNKETENIRKITSQWRAKPPSTSASTSHSLLGQTMSHPITTPHKAHFNILKTIKSL